MDSDPDRNAGRPDLSGESDFHPAAPATIVETPAVTHPGAGPSSAMVTRSRARGGREIDVGPEVESRPEMGILPEVEIPSTTCEGGSGATRHLPDTASQYRPEIDVNQDITTSTTSTHTITPNITPHTITSNPTPHNITNRGNVGVYYRRV